MTRCRRHRLTARARAWRVAVEAEHPRALVALAAPRRPGPLARRHWQVGRREPCGRVRRPPVFEPVKAANSRGDRVGYDRPGRPPSSQSSTACRRAGRDAERRANRLTAVNLDPVEPVLWVLFDRFVLPIFMPEQIRETARIR